MSVAHKFLLVTALGVVASALVAVFYATGVARSSTSAPALPAVGTSETGGTANNVAPTSSTVSAPVASGSPILRLQILSGAPEIREKAIGMLVELLRKGIGREVLSEMLDSGLPELEEEALHQIANLPQEARPLVLEKCLDNKSKFFRLEALQQMRDLNGPDVNGLLVKAMQDTELDVQSMVVDLFASFGDQPLHKAAAAGLKSSNEAIRAAALGYLHDTRAWLSLEILVQQGLNSTYADVVHGSADALRALTQADVNTDNYSDWYKWYKSNGKKWAVENDPTFGTVAPSTQAPLPPGYEKTGNRY